MEGNGSRCMLYNCMIFLYVLCTPIYGVLCVCNLVVIFGLGDHVLCKLVYIVYLARGVIQASSVHPFIELYTTDQFYCMYIVLTC